MADITWGGVLTTAGDLVFGGGREGYFLALDARTGELLWRESLGGQINAGAMSYAVNGRQYVAIAAGSALFSFALPERASDSMAQRDVLELGIDELQPGRYQPRLQLREESLAELAESIREQGVLQPLIVRAVPAPQAGLTRRLTRSSPASAVGGPRGSRASRRCPSSFAS